MLQSVFQTVLLLAAVLCALTAGFLFAFAVVVMPGIRNLDDAGFLRAFQVIDRVIQDNQPLFLLMWVGSVVAVIAAAVLAFPAVDGLERVLTVLGAVVYLVGVQVPTGTINIPLNNRLKRLDVPAMAEEARRVEREAFERRWNRWNAIRTFVAVAVAVLLQLVLLRV